MRDKIIQLTSGKVAFKKHFTTIASTLLVAAAAIYWASSKKQVATREYLSAQQAWQEGDFSRLRTIIDKHPELHPVYDGRIAQIELATSSPRLFDRVAHGSSLFDRFSQTSAVIAKGKLRKALAQSEKLKVEVDPSQDLYGFILMRIAILQGALGDRAAEKIAWEEVKKSAAFPHIADHFKEQQVSLSDYIAQKLAS